MKKKNETIIIIGAGAAGLMAAKRLSKRFQIVVLEADDRIGGRIYTSSIPGFSRPIEAGAEFIHGKLPLTMKLLEKAGIAPLRIKGSFYHATDGVLNHRYEMMEDWDKLLGQMKKEKHDMTLVEFLQKHYAGENCHEFREQITHYAEGFDVADITRASMKSLYNEWANEQHETYRIPGGYVQLINYLAEECKRNGVEIITGNTVDRIEWEKNKVIISAGNNKRYTAEKCIVTIPLPLLRERISFSPSLDEYATAAGEVGYGTVIKIVIEFDQPFWNAYAEDIGFVISDQPIPTWWTQLPDAVPILTGWKGGPGAARMSAKSEGEILQVALDSLSGIFKINVNELKQRITASKVLNWLNDEYAKGAYSYSYLASKKAKQLLNEAVDNTIFFAGEGLYSNESGGTVEAALVSGKKLAAKIRGL